MIAKAEWMPPRKPTAAGIAKLLRGQLTREEKIVLVAIYDQCATTAETAEAMGLPEATVIEILDELVRRAKAASGSERNAA
ncbi:MAG TPA: hypothetical protein VGE52_12850 [Pirellulales bacterium]